MQRGRRIAFDYGQVRIGVAVCDPDGIISTPLPVLRAQSKNLKEEIVAMIAQYQPIKIFVGLPKQLSGDEGSSAEKARNFANYLSEISEVEVVLIDERLSTVSAQSKLRDLGKSTKESRRSIDSVAAVEILEAGIAHERLN